MTTPFNLLYYKIEWRNGGIAEWPNGNRMAEMVELRNGGMAEWREWRYGRKNGRMAEWQKWLHTYYLRYTHTDDTDDDAL